MRQDKPTDERRRRLLQEEVKAEAPRRADETRASRAKPGGSRYAPAANLDRQMRVTDLIPARLSMLALWFFLGALIIAGLEVLYYYMPVLAKQASDGRVAAFDLDGEGSLAAYFSSLQLALAGLTALLVYLLRRHRLDDYRGRYRIWLWAAACWFIMSVDESGSLHEGFKELISHATGQRLLGDGSVWWAMAYGLVLAVLGVWLLVEMRGCWSSTTALLLAAASYAVAVAAQLQLLLPQRGARGVMLEEGCEMGGNLLLWLSMALHARYVIRDVQGLIVHREADKEEGREIVVKRRRPAKKQDLAGDNAEDARDTPAPAISKPELAAETRPAAAKVEIRTGASLKPTTTIRSTQAAASPTGASPTGASPASPSASSYSAGGASAAADKGASEAAKKTEAKAPAAESKPAAESWFSRALGLARAEKRSGADEGADAPGGMDQSRKPEIQRADPPQEGGPRKLSKAERKALKRMQRLEREDDS